MMFQQMDDWECVDATLRKLSKDANATTEGIKADPLVAYREEIGRMSASSSFASAGMLATGTVVNKRLPSRTDSS